jgi:hypothetical protein
MLPYKDFFNFGRIFAPQKPGFAGVPPLARPMATCGDPAPPEANPQDLRPLAHSDVPLRGTAWIQAWNFAYGKTPEVIPASTHLLRRVSIISIKRSANVPALLSGICVIRESKTLISAHQQKNFQKIRFFFAILLDKNLRLW